MFDSCETTQQPLTYQNIQSSRTSAFPTSYDSRLQILILLSARFIVAEIKVGWKGKTINNMRYRYLFEKKNIRKLLYVCRHNKKNKAVEEAYEAVGKDVKVFGFYHAYCLCEGWRELVSEQFEHLRTSGLYDRMEMIYCTVICNKAQLLEFQTIGGSKCKIVFSSEDPSFFEFPALIAIQKKASVSKEDFLGFYFHTKGASLMSVPKVYAVDRTWRKMNEYFLLDRWRLAVAALLQGYDVYGTNYEEVYGDKFRLIGINFFWFRSAYVKTLRPLGVNHQYRSATEIWILYRTHNVYCPYYFTGNHRYDPIPEELYMPCSSSFRKYRIMFKSYFSRFVYIFLVLFKRANKVKNPYLKY